MSHRLDATVFVYRHRETRAIRAFYLDEALPIVQREELEHIATLEPRMWIEGHYDDAVKAAGETPC
jgi:hypothetical protein